MALSHGEYETSDSAGWRICKQPCYCGKEFFPDYTNAARPLQPHEYKVGHEAYRALPEDEYGDEDDGEGGTEGGN